MPITDFQQFAKLLRDALQRPETLDLHATYKELVTYVAQMGGRTVFSYEPMPKDVQ